ncbi:Pentatricopeptide repeat-containing protein [Zostera marina]|uniref:Pentatricopeptide repeat-containing protein n=1 Tax=Zostera marina TaxID=29655 RepID=A0A0K9NKK4_ZOSMR|nr:Pentatricopeptide repeat-containing protein [Zostera marina]
MCFIRWAKPSSFRQVLQLHALIITTGAHLQEPALTHLLKLLSEPEIGDNAHALVLFNTIPRPSTFQWNTLLKSASTALDPISLFREMIRSGDASPNEYTFHALFKYCVKTDVEGKVIHGCFLKLFDAMYSFVGKSLVSMYGRIGGLIGDARKVFDVVVWKDEFLWATMIGVYVKNGMISNASKLFDEMPMSMKDAVSWTTMISAYSQTGQPEEGLAFFTRMLDAGVCPDAVTMVSVISCCAQLRDLHFGKLAHEYLTRNEVDLSRNLVVALIDMYGKCGDLVSARHLFDDMGWRFWQAWNAMIDGYSKSGDLDSARDIFDQMDDRRNLVSFNSMIIGYIQNSKINDALTLFSQMRNSGPDPDVFTVSDLLTSFANTGGLNEGKVLHGILIKAIQTDNNDVFIGTSLLNMYAKCGRIDNAIQVFEKMIHKDGTAWSAMISGLATNGKGELALEYFYTMRNHGISPNSGVYVGVLNACSHSGLLDEGRRNFKRMKYVDEIEPEIEHYGCMVDLLGRTGCLDEAEELIKSMPMEPSGPIWNSLLGACRVHKKINLAEKVADKIFHLDPFDNGVYVQLYNIYESCGRREDASTVRRVMEKRGIKKPKGYSSIIVCQRMHVFSAGEKSHPEILDIQKMSVEIAEKLKQVGYVSNPNANVMKYFDEEEMESYFLGHSERIAVAYGIMKSRDGRLPIYITKNLRICEDCHTAIALIAKIWDRKIVVRDRSRFHHFEDGNCSCHDFW